MNHRVLAALAVVLGASATFGQTADVAVGDRCVVAIKMAPLQKGDNLVGTLPKGTQLRVAEVRSFGGKSWAKTTNEYGLPIEGWVNTANLVPCPEVPASGQKEAPSPYVTLAQVVNVAPLGPDLQALRRAEPKETAEISASFRKTLLTLARTEEEAKGDLKQIAKQVREEVEFSQKLWRAINEHPDYAGLPREYQREYTVSASGSLGVQAMLLPTPNVGVSATGTVGGSYTTREILPTERLDLLRLKGAHHIDELRALAIVLADQAAAHAGPAVRRGQALVIDLVEPYEFEAQGSGPLANPDRASFTNNTGIALTNCTLQVNVKGKDDNALNVHFIPRWKAGETLTAFYYPGIKAGERYLFRSTATNAQTLEASLWCDQLRQEGMVYRYSDDERETQLKQYVGGATITAACSRYAEVTAGNQVVVAFGGVPQMPAGSVVASVWYNGKWRTDKFSTDGWKSGEKKTFYFYDDAGAEGVAATEVRVTLGVVRGLGKHQREFAWYRDDKGEYVASPQFTPLLLPSLFDPPLPSKPAEKP